MTPTLHECKGIKPSHLWLHERHNKRTMMSSSGIPSEQAANAVAIDWPEAIELYYDVAHELGSGGYGKVFLATHKPTQCKVALKVLLKEPLVREGDLHSVEAEVNCLIATTAAQAQHITKLVQVYEDQQYCILVLELHDGGDLVSLLEKRPLGMSSQLAGRLFVQIVKGLHALHSCGFAMRDLKPDNIMLNADESVHLIDFGLASRLDDATRYTQTICGTRTFTAPEVVNDLPYRADVADMWSLGAVLYLMSAGKPAYDDDGLSDHDRDRAQRQQQYDVPPNASPLIEQTLKGLLEYDPEQRMTLSQVMSLWEINAQPEQAVERKRSGALMSLFTRKKTVDRSNATAREKAAAMIAKYFRTTKEEVDTTIDQWRYGEVTALFQCLTLPQSHSRSPKRLPSPPLRPFQECVERENYCHPGEDVRGVVLWGYPTLRPYQPPTTFPIVVMSSGRWSLLRQLVTQRVSLQLTLKVERTTRIPTLTLKAGTEVLAVIRTDEIVSLITELKSIVIASSDSDLALKFDSQEDCVKWAAKIEAHGKKSASRRRLSRVNSVISSSSGSRRGSFVGVTLSRRASTISNI
eukprot:m.98386 g.98386  ORF g.98386 m.98386 type:complete len:579 (+) comp13124_c0_seq6:285-2021(+)